MESPFGLALITMRQEILMQSGLVIGFQSCTPMHACL